MNLSKTIVALTVLAAFSAPAAAEQPHRDRRTSDKPGSERRSPTSRAPARIKHYDFEGDELDGELAHPDGDELSARPPGTFSSLIRLRKSFLPEVIAEGADLLRR